MVVCGEAMTLILTMLKSNIELSGTQILLIIILIYYLYINFLIS
jgi:hypothetical protein